ncbi:phosphatase PAP2 family protein [Alphaproteobacteria bacterium]|nr:phosphatase PAP2 family protein [Alphaproteobacteria bacterium]
MIKKIQIEIIILTFLVINIFLSHRFDTSLYNYFSKLNYGQGSVYLKGFFIGITSLGDSLWYFLIFFITFLASFFLYNIKLISLKKYSYLKNFSLYGFVYLFLVGLVTQIIKHLIGRPRPNHTDFSESLVFNFFSTESSFHSFPSGHSSTTIAVLLIVCLLLPRLKIFFYVCSFLIAVSRVVVGAHFVTDVIAGGVVAIIIYKIINLFFEKKFPDFSTNNFVIQNISMITNMLLIFFVIAIFITLGFKFDIFFSSLFYYENNQFLLQSYDSISVIFRKILLYFLVIYIFILPVLSKYFPLQKIYFGYKFSFKEIVYIWVSGLTTLILIVNILLKNMWGRVRPNDILEFGGTGLFTPWYKVGDSCISNCSFVSGDASVGYVLIVFYFIMKKNIYCYLSVGLGTILGFVRIIAGGHFFSDVVFSQIVVTISIAISFVIYSKLNDK